TGRRLENSRNRLRRMNELLEQHHGQLDVDRMSAIMRDRQGVPDALCRELGDEDSDIITFASVIAEPVDRRISVAVGPPSAHPYRTYEIGTTSDTPSEHVKQLSRME